MKFNNLTSLLLAVCMVGLVSFGPAVMAVGTIVVKPSMMDGWAFRTAHSTGGTITSTAGFELGPGAPPAGSGSAQFTTGSDGDSYADLRNRDYHGVKLSDLTTLTYSTYITTELPPSCVAGYVLLSVDVDGDGIFDPAGGPDDGLFFEPCYQTGLYGTDPPGQTIPVQNGGVVTLGSWQSWDALNGGWWSAKYGGLGGPPLTLITNYLARLADMGYTNPKIANTNDCLGGVRLRGGPGAGAWPNFDGNVDAFTIGVSGINTTYDFEYENKPIPSCFSPIPPQGGIAACKFYDANANGVFDPGEVPLNNWPMTINPLDGAIPPVATQVTSDGCAIWTNLDPAFAPYTITEGTPIQSNWFHSTATSMIANVTTAVLFGNYCTAPSGGLTIGFWGNKNGQALITASDLTLLRACNLVNANGSPFDPTTAAQVKTWLQNANSTNMAYMLSAQLAAMKLNVAHGFVSGSAVDPCSHMTISALISAADASLLAHPLTTAGSPYRRFQESLKNCLDALNNGGPTVSPTPCSYSFGAAPQALQITSTAQVGQPAAWNVKAMFP